jgi:hypothetical protein
MEIYEQAIEQLKNINLSAYPHKEIIDLIGKLGQFGLLKITLHPGQIILRGRPEAGSFNKREQLSYKPQANNNTYQRASTPFQTMFYGTIISEKDMADKPDFFPRLVTALEASKIIRDNGDGIEPLTYSQWVVTRDISLLAICYHKDFFNNSTYTKELARDFLKMSEEQSPALHAKTVKITNFLADVFAKEVRSDAPDYEYLISAIFTEISLQRSKGELHGIYYPSVRAQGGGYVVAIMPEIADNNLRLTAAGECIVYKKGLNITVDNETACVIEDDTKEFTMIPVDSKNKIGREQIVTKLGLI